MKNHLILFCFLFIVENAEAIEFLSGVEKVNLIELYTSEGCSSCPPADKWLSKLKNEKGLWKQFVPLAFHVDYWDYLGWKDKFADSKHAVRQDNYANRKFVSSVYTPAVLLNGRGWRGWRFFNDHNETHTEKPGILKASITNNTLNVIFSPTSKLPTPLILNITLLGTNLKSRVTSGENKGEYFSHDFVVLMHKQVEEERIKNNNSAKWNILNFLQPQQFEADAIAIWITRSDDPTPIQATGSWLK